MLFRLKVLENRERESLLAVVYLLMSIDSHLSLRKLQVEEISLHRPRMTELMICWILDPAEMIPSAQDIHLMAMAVLSLLFQILFRWNDKKKSLFQFINTMLLKRMHCWSSGLDNQGKVHWPLNLNINIVCANLAK